MRLVEIWSGFSVDADRVESIYCKVSEVRPCVVVATWERLELRNCDSNKEAEELYREVLRRVQGSERVPLIGTPDGISVRELRPKTASPEKELGDDEISAWRDARLKEAQESMERSGEAVPLEMKPGFRPEEPLTRKECESMIEFAIRKMNNKSQGTEEDGLIAKGKRALRLFDEALNSTEEAVFFADGEEYEGILKNLDLEAGLVYEGSKGGLVYRGVPVRRHS